MTRVVALLAAALVLGPAAGCGGGDGAEPGASREATLMLDFTPNAVHAGLYAAAQRGWFTDAGVEVEIREPGDSTDAPKLLAAGRIDFAVLDINDYGVALDRGLELEPIAALVQVPLAAVIAGDRTEVRRPRDLEGRVVGVTGLPSDLNALEAVVNGDGGSVDAVEVRTIGFDAVPALAAGRVDAATAFWNAEGVALRRLGLRTREFRLGARPGPYPELIVVASSGARSDPGLVSALRTAIERGYKLADEDPDAALTDLLEAVPGLKPAVQRAQMKALASARAFSAGITPGTLDPNRLQNWRDFAAGSSLGPSRTGGTEEGSG